jgi:hypothetical protein
LIKIPTGDGMALVFYKSPQKKIGVSQQILTELR